MTKPNFMIIGAQKAGTKWLSHNLSNHPEVYIYPDEIHYFNLKSNFEKGTTWYDMHFSDATERQTAIGEKTPNYLWIVEDDICTPFGTHLAQLHRSIHEYAPDVKLIVTLRDPVFRAISAVNHYFRQGQLSPLHHIDDYLVGDRSSQAAKYGVFDMGNYYDALNAYFEFFDIDQFLVLVFETDIVESPKSGLTKACSFLDISTDHEFGDKTEKANEFAERSIGFPVVTHVAPQIDHHLRRIERRLPNAVSSRVLGPPVKKQIPSDAAIEALANQFQESNQRLFQLIEKQPQQWL